VTHKHPEVLAWLDKHPRFHIHFTPTSSSWLNMVERFLRDITDKRIRRGVFTSVPDLEVAINGVHRRAQRSAKTVHLDRHRQRHPRQDHPYSGCLE